mmetsp:Transcript_24159/g.39860  ORF Transcript_24159/g.39860 Transcript_24159/m.39860 type:complete len:688 (-) Transcript_24159:13-2076(-)
MPPMKRKKGISASANARAAAKAIRQSELSAIHEKDAPTKKRFQTYLTLLVSMLVIRWLLLPTQTNPHSKPDVDSKGQLQMVFDEFFAANVQPLWDRAFNGTQYALEESSRVGHQLKEQNARVKHPVVIVPGFVTSALELWEGESCMKKNFRQRVWGSASMARTFFADRDCWRKHLQLNPQTGMDPDNIRVRSAQGFEAADNFIATYWVWSKLIENLADVGYDGSSMSMMSYDWRLGYEYLEKRDGYFSKLKAAIETHHKTSGEKVVLVSHSMGSSVVYYFLQWVVTDGGGGKDWVENNVHSFVNIAGTLLGVPKSIPALFSGELKDIAVLMPQIGDLLENFFGRRVRKNLWNTWGSLYGMLPKGGDAIWGSGADLDEIIDPTPTIVWNNGTEEFCSSSLSTSIVENTTPTDEKIDNGFTDEELELYIPASRQWTMNETIDHILRTGGGYGSRIESIFSFDSKQGWKERSSSANKRKHWHDPVASPLPNAPSLKMYCLYGTGLPTERSYYYQLSCDKVSASKDVDVDRTCTAGDSETTCSNGTGDSDGNPPESPFYIDVAAKNDLRNITSGVRFSDGDGSVPLLSLGYMCQKFAEPRSKHNPSGIKVFTRERKHDAEISLTDPGRGGPRSGEHVDILGNVGVIEDVVRIATGLEVEEKVDKDIIVSDLKNIVQRLDEHPSGGLKHVLI